jgi:thioredoxin reductase
MRKHDALVIGGSFAGLSAAMMLARGRRTLCVVDSGKPRNRFAAESHGFFGRDGVPPLELMAEGREKLRAYPNVTFIDAEAVAAAPVDDGFVVTLKNGEKLEASKLILAFGIVDELPDLPGVAERWGHSVLHCPYCHGYEFGKCAPLGVLNVAPQSSHQALLIPEWGPATFFLNGGAEPDAETVRQLRARAVTVEPVRVVALEGKAPDLSAVVLADGRRVALSGLYIAPRFKSNPLAHQLGCEFDEGPLGPAIRVDEMKQTSVPGVFASGDAARTGMQNATLASADGVIAGAAAHRALLFEALA